MDSTVAPKLKFPVYGLAAAPLPVALLGAPDPLLGISLPPLPPLAGALAGLVSRGGMRSGLEYLPLADGTALGVILGAPSLARGAGCSHSIGSSSFHPISAQLMFVFFLSVR